MNASPGTSDTRVARPGPPGTSAVPGTANRYFKGLLDEVRIYPRALSSFRIAQRYADTMAGESDSSTIVWQETLNGESWKCQVTPNDGLGDGIAKNSSSIVADYTNSQPSASDLRPPWLHHRERSFAGFWIIVPSCHVLPSAFLLVQKSTARRRAPPFQD